MDDKFILNGKSYNSRLIIGSGKYKDFKETKEVLEESGAEIITVAISRTNIGQKKDEENLLDVINPKKYQILPNTAGCFSAEESIRVASLARDLLNTNLIKLEVLKDKSTLLPNEKETLVAAKKLVSMNFSVMVYTTDNFKLAIELQDVGCIAIMPLASPIGSGQGISNPENIKKIIKNISVPIIVDAGIGTSSDACIAMEIGCDAVLLNSSLAMANKPTMMAKAMKNAVIAGRNAFLAGRMKKSKEAIPTSKKDNFL
ncbi:MAG: thiazole synthase [Gammaproteobacteria bacterium]|nr:thiazole synthase [Gammaproteobacteria bacterium]|tara:strand:- start:5698 stop:6471 length:774 start_codon:yes stop_codon:yes gene_type:complete